MFTGIVTDVGEVLELEQQGDLRVRIGTAYDVDGIDLGASIACEGCCLTVIALTPWSYQLGNRLEDSGMDLATGFNFLFEIELAVVLYRFAARQPKRASVN